MQIEVVVAAATATEVEAVAEATKLHKETVAHGLHARSVGKLGIKRSNASTCMIIHIKLKI